MPVQCASLDLGGAEMCAGSASQPPAVACSWPVEQAAEADQRSVAASALPKTLPQVR